MDRSPSAGRPNVRLSIRIGTIRGARSIIHAGDGTTILQIDAPLCTDASSHATSDWPAQHRDRLRRRRLTSPSRPGRHCRGQPSPVSTAFLPREGEMGTAGSPFSMNAATSLWRAGSSITGSYRPGSTSGRLSSPDRTARCIGRRASRKALLSASKEARIDQPTQELRLGRDQGSSPSGGPTSGG